MWMQENLLSLNVDKTHLLITGTNQRLRRANLQEDLDMHMGSFDLAQSNVQSENLLRVTIRADLK